MGARVWPIAALCLAVTCGTSRFVAAQEPMPAPPLEKEMDPPPAPEATKAPPTIPATTPAEVTVYCLSYNARGGKCTPVYIRVGGRAQNLVRVGFFESEVGGSGAMWRSAGWSAALLAAQLSDFDPRSMQVSFDIEGWIDGPSAGGLMTVGVLAAVRGDKVREDAAMTGTINPDGTIGPVGGIPYKIEGAAKFGKKLVLIPAGERFMDNDKGESIDLIRHGRDLGVEVKMVTDVFAAYKHLTGVALPRHPEADEPVVTTAIEDVCREKLTGWINRFQRVVNDYKQRTAESRTDRSAEMMQEGLDRLKSALELRNEGEFTVAYWDAIEGTAIAYLAAELSKDIHAYQLGGRRGMVDRVRDNAWLQEDVDAVAERLRNELPESLDQLSMYLSACSVFFESVAYQGLAAAELRNIPANPGQEYDELVITTSGHQILAFANLRLVEDLLDFMAACGGDPIPDNAPLGQVAQFYWRAGQANIAVFDALIIDEYAKHWNVSSATALDRLMSADDDIAILYGMDKAVLPKLRNYFGEGDALVYANLATGLAVYPRSAAAIGKYYSLSAELDDTRQVVGIGKEQTFHDWLDILQDRTRRSIGFLQARGLDMSVATQEYQIARVRRRRELTDQFTALNDLLGAYLQAECIRRLAGFKLEEAAAN